VFGPIRTVSINPDNEGTTMTATQTRPATLTVPAVTAGVLLAVVVFGLMLVASVTGNFAFGVAGVLVGILGLGCVTAWLVHRGLYT
jgi:hypothetical protein